MSSVGATPERPSGWLGRAIIGGFVALGVSTVTMVIAASVAGTMGEAFRDPSVPGADRLLFDWMYGLTHNPVVEFGRGSVFQALALHLAVGMFWAILYAAFFEPRLRGYAPWRAGLIFSMLPFFLSVTVLPLFVDAGLFWSALQAGPLPIIGNLILHMLYGVTLGAVYGAGADWVEMFDASERELAQEAVAMRRAEASAARGIVVGALVGGAAGALIGLFWPMSAIERLIGSWPVALGVAGALSGGAAGALIGSLAGLSVPGTVVAPPSGEAPKRGEPVVAALIPLGAIALTVTLVVSIGSLLLTVGDIHEFGKRAGYDQAIVTGLSILVLVTGGATLLSRLGGQGPGRREHA